MQNIFWPIYKNLENELIRMSENITFNDSQLNVYSLKIAELLIRTVIEIEALSKKLYFDNAGPQKDDLFFDTDCINFLETKWMLCEKIVIVSSHNFIFNNEENKILTPLKKANKRGSSSSEWNRAYQAVKHDRANNIHKANIKNLIRALAALYILNIYNKSDNEIKNNIKDDNAITFDSNIFSVKKQDISFDFTTGEVDPIDNTAVCIKKYPDDNYKKIIAANWIDEKIRKETFINSLEWNMYMQKNPNYQFKNIIDTCRDIGGNDFLKKIISSSVRVLPFIDVPKNIILNKHEQIYPNFDITQYNYDSLIEFIKDGTYSGKLFIGNTKII